ncbi:MAG: hypothetical protein CL846_10325 [Crocinitomicaceae bacterium]|nr:hypothetical protein [Crocinitomicaceae bacterium]|tara:strand:+ start:1416 stop:1604 length:189 start_codon:yes stop_codon:yes gene_type:complete
MAVFSFRKCWVIFLWTSGEELENKKLQYAGFCFAAGCFCGFILSTVYVVLNWNWFLEKIDSF